MPVALPGNAANQAPKIEAPQAPKNAPKRPQDQAGAKQTPAPTKQAVQNSFGDVPGNGNAKQPINAPKLAVTTSKESGPAPMSHGKDDGKTSSAGSAKTPDGAKTPGSAKTPDGAKTPADPKAPADGKAPVDPKSAPGTPGEQVKDAQDQPVKTPDGNEVVYNDQGKPAFIDPATGKVATDGSGNPYAIAPDGTYAQTEDGNYVVYDKANGDNMIAIDNKTGQAITDGKNRPLALTEYGKYLKTPDGSTVVYEKFNGKFGLVATDKNGTPRGNAELPAAVGKDGKFLEGPEGAVVYYDQNGNHVINTGETVSLPAGFDGMETVPVYKNIKTNDLQVTTADGFILQYDLETKQPMLDEEELPIILYNPVDDPKRPPVVPNADPTTTIKNLPQGSERGDPMEIKKGLFKNGELDTNGMYEALAKYDPRDVYDALVNSSKYGGWDKTPTNLPPLKVGKVIHPNEQQSREIIGTLIAWSNMNAHYAPIKDGQVPAILLFENWGSYLDTGYSAGQHSGSVFVSGSNGNIPANLMQVLNNEFSNPAFAKKIGTPGPGKPGPLNEALGEYIANKWTGNYSDNFREDSSKPDNVAKELKNINTAVTALAEEFGGGDLNKGMDILQRAYFAGDPVAMELFWTAYKEAELGI